MKYLHYLMVLIGFAFLGCSSETEKGAEPSENTEIDSQASPVAEEPEEEVVSPGDVASKDAEVPGVEPDVAPDVALDVETEPEESSPVKVRKVEDAADLATGIGAQARVDGAWIVENEVARFYVQDSGVAAGLDLYGGNVIDGVLLKDGVPGPDLFRETFPLVGLKVPTGEGFKVVNDEDGHAMLQVSGTDALSQVVDLLDQLVSGPADLEIVTEYGMVPGIPALRMSTRVRWPEGASKSVLLFGELVAFGRYQQMFTEEAGFGDASELALMRTLATRADGASYGLCMTSGSFSLLGSDAGNTATVYNEIPEEDEDGWIRLERWLIVGEGSPASVLKVAHELQNRDVHTVRGVVTDWASIEAVKQVNVTAFRESENGPVAVNQAITDEIGQFSMTLEAGEYSFLASSQDRERVAPIKLLVEKDLEEVELEISPPGVIRLDLDGPTRVTLQGIDVMPMDAFLGEFSEGGYDRRLYGALGTESFSVRPGEYLATLSRGPEFSILEKTITVAAGEEWVFEEGPVREVASPGWLGGDFHQHTVFSLDSNMPVRTKLIENMVEGVDVAVTTDHDNLSDYAPYVDELGASDLIFTMIGEEISHTGVGHFNAYPIGVKEEDPYAMIGAQFWAGRDPDDMMQEVLEMWPDAVLQVNHPRGGLSAYYGWLKLDPKTGAVGAEGRKLSTIPVAVEVNEDFVPPEYVIEPSDEELSALAPDDIPAMLDWLNLIQAGYPITGMANSDSHNYGSGTGYPRSYMYVGEEDDLSVMKASVVVNAIRKQRVVMSQGILAWPEVNGQVRLGTDDKVPVGEDGTVEITLHIRAPSWIKVTGVSMMKNKIPVQMSYMDGKVVPFESGTYVWETFDQVEGEPFEGVVVFVLTPEESSNLVFNVSGTPTNTKIFGSNAFALTNPLYVTVP